MVVSSLFLLALGLTGIYLAKVAIASHVQHGQLPVFTKKQVTKATDKATHRITSAQLLASLKGRTVEVPDMSKEFSGWSKGINPFYKKMVPLVDSRLEGYVFQA
jgi:hypothetical protein